MLLVVCVCVCLAACLCQKMCSFVRFVQPRWVSRFPSIRADFFLIQYTHTGPLWTARKIDWTQRILFGSLMQELIHSHVRVWNSDPFAIALIRRRGLLAFEPHFSQCNSRFCVEKRIHHFLPFSVALRASELISYVPHMTFFLHVPENIFLLAIFHLLFTLRAFYCTHSMQFNGAANKFRSIVLENMHYYFI